MAQAREAPPERRRPRASPPCSRRRWASDRQGPESVSLSSFERREIDPSAEPTGDRGQMDDGVGRSAKCQKKRRAFSNAGSVMIWLGRRWSAPIRETAMRPDSSAMRSRSACDGRNCRRVRRHHAQSLGERRHGAGRAHHGAGARGRSEPLLDGIDLLAVDFTGAEPCPEPTAIRAGAEPLAPVVDQSTSGRRQAGSPAGQRKPRP